METCWVNPLLQILQLTLGLAIVKEFVSGRQDDNYHHGELAVAYGKNIEDMVIQ